jgi:DNA adenine methylase
LTYTPRSRGEPLARSEASILSPLRYPGAKRQLSGYIAESLRLNDYRPKLLVEPFAGGASVALQLLNDDLVDEVALGERDPLVASFWKVVFHDTDWLLEKLRRVTVSVTNWKRFKNGEWKTDRERALACIFLNRTSFSGILHRTAGPIGGRSQTSMYSIDCRFNRKTIIKRIEQAAKLEDRVRFVQCADWQSTLRRVQRLRLKATDIFYYLDPPFFAKADRLYNYSFDDKEHIKLKTAVMKLKPKWLLSYDAAPWIRQQYSLNGKGPRHVDLIYSGGRREARELIVSNLPVLPKQTRIWRTVAEWNGAKNGAQSSV